MKMELLRLRFDEQVRSEKRKTAGTRSRAPATGSLKPWREVVTPHKDVASGRYQQAEFAADLWQVHLGEGTDEYRNPVEFFRRTYLTESLKRLLVGARAAPRRQGRRPGGAAPDQLRRRQDALDAGALPPVLRDARRASWPASTRCWQEAGVKKLPDGEARGAGGQQDLARQPGHQARRHGGAHAVGRAGLAARRQEGLRARQGRRREGDEPRRRAARAVQRVRAVPDPDRRVGGLRAPAPRPERPAGRRLRDAVHLRPGAHRVGQAREELPAGDQPARLGHVGLAAHAGRRRRGGRQARARGARPAAQRGRARGVVVAAGERRGGLRDRAAAAVRAAGRSGRSSRHRDVVARAFADLYRTQHQEFPPECQRRRLREAAQGGLPDPPGDLRPALHRLVHAGEVPAHARRAAPDGGGDPQPVGEGRPQPADPAVEHPDRRPARAVRADALPLGQLGAGHREGRGRAQLAAAADRRRGAEPRQVRAPAGAWRARSTSARRRRRRPRTAASRTGG